VSCIADCLNFEVCLNQVFSSVSSNQAHGERDCTTAHCISESESEMV